MRRGGDLLICGLLLFGCSADAQTGVIEDIGFDLWCGKELCSWETEEGRIVRVSTWHTKDYGVELVEAPTTLSQTIQIDSACLVFRIIASIEADAGVSLAVDLGADGQVEHGEELPTLDWHPLELLVRLPSPRTSSRLRVILHKERPGRAIFGELSAEPLQSCPNAPTRLEAAVPP